MLAMMLISVYLYMGYTVSRLTESLSRFALLKPEDLKDEPCRFWLEDKVEIPNRFQRHFNLILMIKDVYVCILLLALYKQVPVMLILLLIQQTVFFCLALANPPYSVGWNNNIMLVTQGLYILLDIAFLVNVLAKLTSEQRYFYVGFSMIGIVLVIIIANMLVGMYYQTKETYLRCKQKRDLAKVAASTEVTKSSANDNRGGIAMVTPPSKVVEANGASSARLTHDQSEQRLGMASQEGNLMHSISVEPTTTGRSNNSLAKTPAKHGGNEPLRRNLPTKRLAYLRARLTTPSVKPQQADQEKP